MQLLLRTLNKVLLAGLASAIFTLCVWACYLYAGSPPLLLKDVPFSTAFFDRHGKLLRLTLAADDKYRLYTPLVDMGPDLVATTLLQEDRHFYSHAGVNPLSIFRGGYETYIKRSRPMGASTITMQVVRLHDRLDTRTITGKLTQIFRALRLEHFYTKDQILEAYLNLAPYGGNIHGAGTAALIYFGQSAKDLALPQSLGLAVIPQNPVRRFPLNTDGVTWTAARRRLFNQLPETYQNKAEQLDFPLTVSTREKLPFFAPQYLDSLPVETSGIIKTTLDLGLQTSLQTAVQGWLRQRRVQGLDNAAVMLMHVPTMEVRALIGSADFFDSSIAGQVDGTSALRSPGSTLKPFVYALGLEQGLIHSESLLEDAPAFFAEYRPGNFDDRFVGALPAREALTLSRNIPAIALASKLKNPDLYDFLQDAGAHFPESRLHYGLSMVVGGAETDMRTLVRLYAMLANGGELRDLKYIEGQASSPPRSILSPEAALVTLTMLQRPDPERPLFAASQSIPVYWKTGTSSSFRDAWTIGIAGPYVLAVWTGHFDGRPSPALVGTEAAAPLFFNLLDVIAQHDRLTDIVKQAMTNLNITHIASNDAEKGWFIPGKSPFAAPIKQRSKLDILTPRSGISYVAHANAAEPLRIPLEANTNSQQRPVYWFADNALIGVASDAAPVFWSPEPGLYTIRGVDTQGRSAARAVRIVGE